MLIRRTFLAATLAAPAVASCASSDDQPLAMPELPHDRHSYARPNDARVTHVELDLAADFDRKVFSGTCTLSILVKPGIDEIILDVHSLNIRGVRTDRGETTWRIGNANGDRGAPMHVMLPPGSRRVIIDYETSPEAGALQWLSPSMTASNKPFLFSQGQSILTRTWVPTQDSPGIRQTYEARIVAPEGLKALMSAEMLTPRGEGIEGGGGRAYRFRMTRRIPPYLIAIAIAIGDLEFRAIGDRTGVYAEPSVVDRAASEFQDMQRMLHAAEALYGDYRWGRYDVLVLPPSFPYGGMENPRLTFATPTLLAGDRSLVNVIAHELAHSWSGNLVTNAVWADFWLNEGFTTYFEGRITEALYGADQADMQNVLAWAGIQTAIATAPADSTRLHLIGERGADDYNAAIAYAKGALFLRTVERTVGRERFDDYLRSYFDRHAFQPITTAEFLTDIRARLVRGDADLESRLMLDAWAYEPGLPSNVEEPRAAGFDRVAEQVAAFTAGGPASAIPWGEWGTLQRQRFLQTIPRELSQERLAELESTLQLNANGNGEVLFDWLVLAVRNRYEPALPALEAFVLRQGRRKYVQPLYRALMTQGEWGQPVARRIYAQARPTYHPVAVTSIDPIVLPQ